MKNKINIGITIGDVNGIGLEILGKYLSSNYFKKIDKRCILTIFGNYEIVIDYFSKLQGGKKYLIFFDNLVKTNQIQMVEIKEKVPIQFGKVSESAGKVAFESINYAIRYLQNNSIDCLVTLPISKESIKHIQPNFIGHTEYIAQHFSNAEPLMTFVYKNIKLCLLTTHQPLRIVPTVISIDMIIQKSKIFENSLRKDFKISVPRIAILGLNPHSGENGLIGNEELETFVPAIEKLKNSGIQIDGPFPSDGFFAFGLYKKYDGIIACYHDQGLIPFKLISKGKGVNFTANLPIVRTSPDHGTGFDIAGKNIADFTSLKNSIELAFAITSNRQLEKN